MDTLPTPVAPRHQPARRPRLALLVLPNFDHFVQDLIDVLPGLTGYDIMPFRVTSPAVFQAALAWTDRPDLDAVWFEFCWPPFPRLIAQTDFGGRRVLVRVHRVEAVETNHVATTPWDKVSDLIVVSTDMAARVRKLVPGLERTTRLHLVHCGVDIGRFAPLQTWNPHRIGWCGLMTVRKNPTLALEILYNLRALDARYHLHISSTGGEVIATEPFFHLARRLRLMDAVHIDGAVPPSQMPAWHARNGILLHTSLHESFGFGMAEAASVGCDLAVLDYPGAEEFWPEATRFGTPDEAVTLIRNAAPHRWRAHIAQRFSLDRHLGAMADLFRQPALEKVP